MTLNIPKVELNKILKHGEETFPDECCGVLIGVIDDEDPIISEARRMRNSNEGSQNNRYNIDPMDLIHLEDELDEKNLLMIGIYHSHPNHSARPSKYDLDHAWPNLSYMVVSVDEGKSTKLTSWRLNQTIKQFDPEEITET